MGKVFHRKLNRPLPLAVKGEGVWVTDSEGKRYLDAGASGAGMTALGHGNREVADAIAAQAGTLAFMHGAMFTSAPLEALAEELVDHAPPSLTHAFFASGGSESIEVALMLARQHACESGKPQRHRIIARRNGFHGATLATMAIGDAAARRAPFEPWLQPTLRVSAPYAYRHQQAQESEDAYAARLAAELEAQILEADPGTVLAFVAETVGGSTSGALTAPTGYLRRVREVCDRHGVLLILDEVYCGLGRTGTLHACVAEGVAPDLLVVAKGLAAGFAPIGAVLTTRAIRDAIANGSGSFKGGYTHSGHVLSCAAALAVQRIVRRDGLVDNVARQGNRLRGLLADRFGSHPHVGDIRGRGLLQAIELVQDPGTREPFQPERGLATLIAQETMQRGLLCMPAAGAIDGRRGDHVLLAPPFIADDGDVDQIVCRLGDAVDAAVRRALP